MTKKFKPTLLPTLFTIPSVIILIILGTWQVQRLQWKNELIETFEQETAKTEVVWPVSDWDDQSLQYRKIILNGTFLHEHEMFLYKNYQGKPGYDIVTPFKTDTDEAILVNRGWIPMDKRHETFHDVTDTTIDGLLIKEEKQGLFIPDNNPSKNVWFWMDINEAEHITNMDFPPYIARMIGVYEPNIYPIKADASLKFRNDHLQYAIIWYSFAIALLIIYYVYHRKSDNTHVK